MSASFQHTLAIRQNGQFGPILQKLRRDKGWSQAELGSKIGLSQARISVIESKPESVSIDQMLTVLMALGYEINVAPRTGKTDTPDLW